MFYFFLEFKFSSRSAGVCVIISNSLISYSKFQTDYDGRLLYIDIKFDNKCFRLVNIYAPVVSQDRDSFLFDLVKYFVTSSELILVGDFNFIDNSKLDKINGNLDKQFSSCKIFNNISRTYSLIDTFRYLFPNKKAVTW